MSSESAPHLMYLAMAIGHELRNDMLSISMHAHLLEGRLPDDPSVAALARSAERARATVEDLVALARESKTFEPMNVSSVIEASKLDLEANWVDAIIDDPIVMAHGSLLARAIATLYRNAIALSPSVPTLQTRARIENEMAIIEVEDDGPGVDPSVQTTLFEPLVTGRPGGTGIGLAMCRSIVELHGGRVELVASPIHAVFRISLPVAQ